MPVGPLLCGVCVCVRVYVMLSTPAVLGVLDAVRGHHLGEEPLARPLCEAARPPRVPLALHLGQVAVVYDWDVVRWLVGRDGLDDGLRHTPMRSKSSTTSLGKKV